MRHYQRGIATSIILTIFLLSAVAIASAYFVFSQKQQKTKVNSFEECAKLYPVMESYPQQCNTPDGKHFARELSKEEMEKISPQKSSANITDTSEQATVQNEYFSFKYPDNFKLTERKAGSGDEVTYYTFQNEKEVYRIDVGLGTSGWYEHFNSKETEIINGIDWIVIPVTQYCDAGECGLTTPGFYLRRNDYYIGADVLEGKGSADSLKKFLSTFRVLK